LQNRANSLANLKDLGLGINLDIKS